VDLVELSVMEQRYQAVMAVVQEGWKVTEVAVNQGGPKAGPPKQSLLMLGQSVRGLSLLGLGEP
jgi:hypothetical protein